ncbi:RIC1 protein [Toxoplasma gondii VAND]|uniref:RIC1 protein n=1 Tax=Toxoplasma gondii VAND TaxID=933077 RepID=A0A086PFP8_TOXGO|nr:RIC1 protein [Toxoplasma gondii VAND]
MITSFGQPSSLRLPPPFPAAGVPPVSLSPDDRESASSTSSRRPSSSVRSSSLPSPSAETVSRLPSASFSLSPCRTLLLVVQPLRLLLFSNLQHRVLLASFPRPPHTFHLGSHLAASWELCDPLSRRRESEVNRLAAASGARTPFYRIFVTCYPQATVCVYTVGFPGQVKARKRRESEREETSNSDAHALNGDVSRDESRSRPQESDGENKRENSGENSGENRGEEERKKKGFGEREACMRLETRLRSRASSPSLFPPCLFDADGSFTSGQSEDESEDEDDAFLFATGSDGRGLPGPAPLGTKRGLSGGGTFTPATVAAALSTPSLLLQHRPASLRSLELHLHAVLSLPVRGSASACSASHLVVGCSRQPALLFLPLDAVKTVNAVLYLSDFLPLSQTSSSTDTRGHARDDVDKREETESEQEDDKRGGNVRTAEGRGSDCEARLVETMERSENSKSDRYVSCFAGSPSLRASSPSVSSEAFDARATCGRCLFSPMGHESVQEFIRWQEQHPEDVVLLPDLPDEALQDARAAQQAHRHLEEFLRRVSEDSRLSRAGSERSVDSEAVNGGESDKPARHGGEEEEGRERNGREVAEKEALAEQSPSLVRTLRALLAHERSQPPAMFSRLRTREDVRDETYSPQPHTQPKTSLSSSVSSPLSSSLSSSLSSISASFFEPTQDDGRLLESSGPAGGEANVEEARRLQGVVTSLSEGIAQIALDLRLSLLGVVTTQGRLFLLSWDGPLLSGPRRGRSPERENSSPIGLLVRERYVVCCAFTSERSRLAVGLSTGEVEIYSLDFSHASAWGPSPAGVSSPRQSPRAGRAPEAGPEGGDCGGDGAQRSRREVGWRSARGATRGPRYPLRLLRRLSLRDASALGPDEPEGEMSLTHNEQRERQEGREARRRKRGERELGKPTSPRGSTSPSARSPSAPMSPRSSRSSSPSLSCSPYAHRRRRWHKQDEAEEPPVETVVWSDDGLALVVRWGSQGSGAKETGLSPSRVPSPVAVFSYTGRLLFCPFPPREELCMRAGGEPLPRETQPSSASSEGDCRAGRRHLNLAGDGICFSPRPESRERLSIESLSSRDSTGTVSRTLGGRVALQLRKQMSPIPPATRPPTCAWTGLGLGLVVAQDAQRHLGEAGRVERPYRRRASFDSALLSPSVSGNRGDSSSEDADDAARAGDRRQSQRSTLEAGEAGDLVQRQRDGRRPLRKRSESEDGRRREVTAAAHAVSSIFEFPVFRSAWLGVATNTVDTAGSRAASDTGDRILIGASCLLVWASAPHVPSSLSWSRIPLPPPAYLSPNWPIRQASLSPNGDTLLVCGRRGFAVFSLSQRKWRLVGDEQQERQLPTSLLPLGWYDSSIFFISIRTFDPDASPADSALAALAPLPVNSLSASSGLLRSLFPSQQARAAQAPPQDSNATWLIDERSLADLDGRRSFPSVPSPGSGVPAVAPLPVWRGPRGTAHAAEVTLERRVSTTPIAVSRQLPGLALQERESWESVLERMEALELQEEAAAYGGEAREAATGDSRKAMFSAADSGVGEKKQKSEDRRPVSLMGRRVPRTGYALLFFDARGRLALENCIAAVRSLPARPLRTAVLSDRQKLGLHVRGPGLHAAGPRPSTGGGGREQETGIRRQCCRCRSLSERDGAAARTNDTGETGDTENARGSCHGVHPGSVHETKKMRVRTCFLCRNLSNRDPDSSSTALSAFQPWTGNPVLAVYDALHLITSYQLHAVSGSGASSVSPDPPSYSSLHRTVSQPQASSVSRPASVSSWLPAASLADSRPACSLHSPRGAPSLLVGSAFSASLPVCAFDVVALWQVDVSACWVDHPLQIRFASPSLLVVHHAAGDVTALRLFPRDACEALARRAKRGPFKEEGRNPQQASNENTGPAAQRATEKEAPVDGRRNGLDVGEPRAIQKTSGPATDKEINVFPQRSSSPAASSSPSSSLYLIPQYVAMQSETLACGVTSLWMDSPAQLTVFTPLHAPPGFCLPGLRTLIREATNEGEMRTRRDGEKDRRCLCVSCSWRLRDRRDWGCIARTDPSEDGRRVRDRSAKSEVEAVSRLEAAPVKDADREEQTATLSVPTNKDEKTQNAHAAAVLVDACRDAVGFSFRGSRETGKAPSNGHRPPVSGDDAEDARVVQSSLAASLPRSSLSPLPRTASVPQFPSSILPQPLNRFTCTYTPQHLPQFTHTRPHNHLPSSFPSLATAKEKKKKEKGNRRKEGESEACVPSDRRGRFFEERGDDPKTVEDEESQTVSPGEQADSRRNSLASAETPRKSSEKVAEAASSGAWTEGSLQGVSGDREETGPDDSADSFLVFSQRRRRIKTQRCGDLFVARPLNSATAFGDAVCSPFAPLPSHPPLLSLCQRKTVSPSASLASVADPLRSSSSPSNSRLPSPSSGRSRAPETERPHWAGTVDPVGRDGATEERRRGAAVAQENRGVPQLDDREQAESDAAEEAEGEQRWTLSQATWSQEKTQGQCTRMQRSFQRRELETQRRWRKRSNHATGASWTRFSDLACCTVGGIYIWMQATEGLSLAVLSFHFHCSSSDDELEAQESASRSATPACSAKGEDCETQSKGAKARKRTKPAVMSSSLSSLLDIEGRCALLLPIEQKPQPLLIAGVLAPLGVVVACSPSPVSLLNSSFAGPSVSVETSAAGETRISAPSLDLRLQLQPTLHPLLTRLLSVAAESSLSHQNRESPLQQASPPSVSAAPSSPGCPLFSSPCSLSPSPSCSLPSFLMQQACAPAPAFFACNGGTAAYEAAAALLFQIRASPFFSHLVELALYELVDAYLPVFSRELRAWTHAERLRGPPGTSNPNGPEGLEEAVSCAASRDHGVLPRLQTRKHEQPCRDAADNRMQVSTGLPTAVRLDSAPLPRTAEAGDEAESDKWKLVHASARSPESPWECAKRRDKKRPVLRVGGARPEAYVLSLPQTQTDAFPSSARKEGDRARQRKEETVSLSGERNPGVDGATASHTKPGESGKGDMRCTSGQRSPRGSPGANARVSSENRGKETRLEETEAVASHRTLDALNAHQRVTNEASWKRGTSEERRAQVFLSLDELLISVDSEFVSSFSSTPLSGLELVAHTPHPASDTSGCLYASSRTRHVAAQKELTSLPGGQALFLFLQLLTRQHPSLLAKVVASCVRKTDPTRAPLILFPLLGRPPQSFFDDALRSHLLHTASLYLLLLQNVEGCLAVRTKRGLPLLQAALRLGVLGLARKLVRFLLAVVAPNATERSERGSSSECLAGLTGPARKKCGAAELETEAFDDRELEGQGTACDAEEAEMPWSGRDGAPKLWAPPRHWPGDRRPRAETQVKREDETAGAADRRGLVKCGERDANRGRLPARGRSGSDRRKEAHVGCAENEVNEEKQEVIRIYREVVDSVGDSLWGALAHLQWLRLFQLTSAFALDLPAWLVRLRPQLCRLFSLEGPPLGSSFSHSSSSVVSSSKHPSPPPSPFSSASSAELARDSQLQAVPFEAVVLSLSLQLGLPGPPFSVFSQSQWEALFSQVSAAASDTPTLTTPCLSSQVDSSLEPSRLESLCSSVDPHSPPWLSRSPPAHSAVSGVSSDRSDHAASVGESGGEVRSGVRRYVTPLSPPSFREFWMRDAVLLPESSASSQSPTERRTGPLSSTSSSMQFDKAASPSSPWLLPSRLAPPAFVAGSDGEVALSDAVENLCQFFLRVFISADLPVLALALLAAARDEAGVKRIFALAPSLRCHVQMEKERRGRSGEAKQREESERRVLEGLGESDEENNSKRERRKDEGGWTGMSRALLEWLTSLAQNAR